MNQAQKPANPIWGQREDEAKLEIKPLDLGFDVHTSMREAGVQDVSEEEQAKAQADGNARGKRVTLLCCCRKPGCPLGPFTEIEER